LAGFAELSLLQLVLVAAAGAISVVVHLVQVAVFGVAGVIDAGVIAVALLIGVCSVPGAYAARAIVERLHPRVHTATLDAVVLLGSGLMIAGALAH
jgi:uncharacterized membrane protein YfcA